MALPCPLCEYDLRGLAEPRCPECGYRFTWDELADPTRRFHPYLFEHHPQRNFWSFANTLLGGAWPRKFWSTLYPTQPSRPGRVVAYWVLCALPLLAVLAAHAYFVGSEVLQRYARFSGAEDPWLVVRWTAFHDLRDGGYGLVALMALLWPWLTLASLLVFQISLRRARLRSTHVVRCVLYAGDVVLWAALPIGTLVLAAWARIGGGEGVLGVAAAAAWLVLSYRLFAACAFYLRFDRAAETVLASQVMVGLVYLKMWFIARGN